MTSPCAEAAVRHVRQQPVEHLGAALGLPHLLGAHLFEPAGQHDRFAAPVHVELAVDGRHVQLDRALGDVQARGDLLVRQAVGGERQDLDLLGRELAAAQPVLALRAGHRLAPRLVGRVLDALARMRPVSGALQGQAQHDSIWLSVYRRGM